MAQEGLGSVQRVSLAQLGPRLHILPRSGANFLCVVVLDNTEGMRRGDLDPGLARIQELLDTYHVNMKVIADMFSRPEDPREEQRFMGPVTLCLVSEADVFPEGLIPRLLPEGEGADTGAA